MGLKNKRGMSPVIRNFLIIIALLVAIILVILIFYLIVSSQKENLVLPKVDLSINKDWVKINDKDISVNVIYNKGDTKIDKIFFIVYDGTKEEATSLDASDLKEGKEKQFQFTLKNLTSVKSISIRPIIKKSGKEYELDVADTYRVKSFLSGINLENCGDGVINVGEECDDNNLFREDGCSETCEIETCIEQNGYVCLGDKTCTGKLLETPITDQLCCKSSCVSQVLGKCSECTQKFESCDRDKCYQLSERCYYESNQCTSCSSISCIKYINENDCTEDRCNKGCEWIRTSETTGICKILNEKPCNLASECTSDYCYVDEDNDRYSPLNGTKTCRQYSQLEGVDCYDFNSNVNPGQNNFFSFDRGDGSFDYNCDNTLEKGETCNSCTCSLSGICSLKLEGFSPCDKTFSDIAVISCSPKLSCGQEGQITCCEGDIMGAYVSSTNTQCFEKYSNFNFCSSTTINYGCGNSGASCGPDCVIYMGAILTNSQVNLNATCSCR